MGNCCQILCYTILGIFLFLAQLISALVCLGVLCYCMEIEFRDPHVFLSTFGFTFLAVQAILTMNTINTCTTKENEKQRLYAHVILQCMAIVFIILGFAVVTIKPGFSNSAHGVMGIIATFCAVVSVIAGILSYRIIRPCSIVHIILGLITLIMSSVCLITALRTPSFRYIITKWSWMIVGVVIYTIFIFLTVVGKLCLSCFRKTDEYYNECEEYIPCNKRNECPKPCSLRDNFSCVQY